MATEDEANAARRQHGDNLRQLGAHAVGVEEGSAHDKPGWVVVAHVTPGKQAKLPAALKYRTPEGEGEVPLIVARSEMFKPE